MKKIKSTGIVFGDMHFPLHDEKAFSCALKVIEKVKPNVFINLGDFAEGEYVSHWRWSRRRRPPLEYQLPLIDKEADQVNHHMDRIDKALDKVGCKKKYLAMGNHDNWYNAFVEENPYLEQYKPEHLFKIKERGYKWYPYGELFKVEGSKLYAYHGGHYSSINHSRTTVQNLGCNVIYGHTHDCQRSVMQHISGIHIAQSMGCLCKMKKDFLKGRKVNWTHNVGIVDFFTDGWFNLITLDIHNGTTTWNNEIIEGD